jgi:NAD(P)-dependent dehydrogenase (short-subunit alcohol dehydrogenase family)
MRRLATPAVVGDAVALLCLEEVGFVTGQVPRVDGGAPIIDPAFPLDLQQGA